MTSRVRYSVLVAVASVAVIGIAAVLFTRGRSPKAVRIAGRTVGAGGEALPGVRITLEISPSDSEEDKAVERVETVSDERGNFAINFQGHWRGASYGLEARKPGYRTLSVDDAETLKSPVLLRLARSPS